MGMAPFDLMVAFVSFHVVMALTFVLIAVFVAGRGGIRDAYQDIDRMGRRRNTSRVVKTIRNGGKRWVVWEVLLVFFSASGTALYTAGGYLSLKKISGTNL